MRVMHRMGRLQGMAGGDCTHAPDFELTTTQQNNRNKNKTKTRKKAIRPGTPRTGHTGGTP